MEATRVTPLVSASRGAALVVHRGERRGVLRRLDLEVREHRPKELDAHQAAELFGRTGALQDRLAVQQETPPGGPAANWRRARLDAYDDVAKELQNPGGKLVERLSDGLVEVLCR